MPRQYKAKPGARTYTKTSEDILIKAYEEHQAGASQKGVCLKYNITRSVFQRYLNRKKENKPIRPPGGQTVLSLEKEKAIVEHLLFVSEWGFPFDTLDLRMTVKMVLDKKGITVKQFKQNVPGVEWVYSFMTRHKDQLKNRLCQNISKKRAAVNSETISAYFHELKKTLDGVSPENIINYDETNLTDDPGRRKMIFKRGCRYPERIMNSTKSSTSLMLAGTASGFVLPVYIVYKSEHLWSTWTEGGPSQARYNRTKSGWFDTICFQDWFKTIALPYCKKLDPLSKKVLIGDNLSSHFSNEIIFECQQNNISFVCLPPNSTHLCQPLDVAYFAPMKRQWRKILTDYKLSCRKSAGTVPKDVFPKLVKKLMLQLPNQASNLMSGFRKCGLYPLDPQVVLNRLPRDPTTGTERAADSSVSEAFFDRLHEIRFGDSTASGKNKRRKKMDVVPGRSIGVEDTVTSNPQPGPSTSSDDFEDPLPTFSNAPEAEKNVLESDELEEREFLSSDSDSDTDTGSEADDNHQEVDKSRNIFEQFN